jgi:putative transposase
MLIKCIEEAHEHGARYQKACENIGITIRTYQRWKSQGKATDDLRSSSGNHHRPTHALTETERAKVLKVVNQQEYRNLSPNQIVPILAEQGQYLCSESTMYRILRKEKQLTHRELTAPKTPRPKPHLEADGPCQVWSWDITYLPTLVRGLFFKLYLVMDIWSRRIVGYAIDEEEKGELGAALIEQACRNHHILRHQITCHQDNGAPMRSNTFKAKMEKLGVRTSYSRPHVSNDNPYSESLFRTAKYCRLHPLNRFENLKQAREWIVEFVNWYNNEHRHSSLKYITPNDRHFGKEESILEKRMKVYETAKRRHPRRWSRNIRNWNPEKQVTINPVKKAA